MSLIFRQLHIFFILAIKPYLTIRIKASNFTSISGLASSLLEVSGAISNVKEFKGKEQHKVTSENTLLHECLFMDRSLWVVTVGQTLI